MFENVDFGFAETGDNIGYGSYYRLLLNEILPPSWWDMRLRPDFSGQLFCPERYYQCMLTPRCVRSFKSFRSRVALMNYYSVWSKSKGFTFKLTNHSGDTFSGIVVEMNIKKSADDYTMSAVERSYDSILVKHGIYILSMREYSERLGLDITESNEYYTIRFCCDIIQGYQTVVFPEELMATFSRSQTIDIHVTISHEGGDVFDKVITIECEHKQTEMSEYQICKAYDTAAYSCFSYINRDAIF